MRTHDAIIELLNTARFVTSTYLADLSDTDLVFKVNPRANCVAWQLGHLVSSENRMLAGVRAGLGIALPQGFDARHSSQAALDQGAFLPKAEYLRLMQECRAATLKALATLSESDLEQPGPEFTRAYAPKVGSVFIAIGSHEMMHTGQIAVLRRALDKPVVI